MTDVTHKAQQVSPKQSTAAGLAAFVGGIAILSGLIFDADLDVNSVNIFSVLLQVPQ